MKMGDKVVVTALVSGNYVHKEDDTIYRELNRAPIPPRNGFFVGYTYKYSGPYHDGGEQFIFDGKPEGYTPSYISPITATKVYRIKFSERSNDAFALPSDVREANDEQESSAD